MVERLASEQRDSNPNEIEDIKVLTRSWHYKFMSAVKFLGKTKFANSICQ